MSAERLPDGPKAREEEEDQADRNNRVRHVVQLTPTAVHEVVELPVNRLVGRELAHVAVPAGPQESDDLACLHARNLGVAPEELHNALCRGVMD